VERGHLRPRGGRDRESRQPDALDVDRSRWRAEARRRRCDRVRRGPPGAHRAGRRSSPGPATLAARAVIHTASLDRDRRTSGPILEAAVRSAFARAREIGVTSIAFPALGTGVGGFPLDEAARITVDTVRDELGRSPAIEHVIFALRGLAAYQAFERALAELRAPVAPRSIDPGAGGAA
jgi:O-acetyl-ADP-ribose deacetylase (regulator of RNase III)